MFLDFSLTLAFSSPSWNRYNSTSPVCRSIRESCKICSADDNLMVIPKKACVHERSSGSGHGEGGRLVVSALTHEVSPELVDYWATINLGPGFGNGSSKTAICLNRREVPLKEHAHIGG